MKFLTLQLVKENNLIFIFRILLNYSIENPVFTTGFLYFLSFLLSILNSMHPAGFEPAMSRREADYESDAFGHLATDALF